MSRRRGQLDGFLDAGSELKGDLHFRDTFRVEGRISGRVISEGELHVGEQGFVEAELEVARLVIAGKVRGNVTASDRIVIIPGGRLEGDIQTPCLLLEEGSCYEGYCQMTSSRATSPKTATATVARLR